MPVTHEATGSSPVYVANKNYLKIYNYYDIIIIESKKDTVQQFLLMDNSFSLHENDNWFESSAKTCVLP